MPPAWRDLTQRPAGLVETAFDELARRWTPILDAFDKVDVNFALEVHPTEIAFDIASAQRALEVHADVVLMAKSGVDGVYTADPKKDPAATRLDTLTYDEALLKNIRVMDQTAMTMCKDNGLEMVVFGMEGEGNVTRAILGEPMGTRVTA